MQCKNLHEEKKINRNPCEIKTDLNRQIDQNRKGLKLILETKNQEQYLKKLAHEMYLVIKLKGERKER